MDKPSRITRSRATRSLNVLRTRLWTRSWRRRWRPEHPTHRNRTAGNPPGVVDKDGLRNGDALRLHDNGSAGALGVVGLEVCIVDLKGRTNADQRMGWWARAVASDGALLAAGGETGWPSCRYFTGIFSSSGPRAAPEKPLPGRKVFIHGRSHPFLHHPPPLAPVSPLNPVAPTPAPIRAAPPSPVR